ncbi:PREDICTED: TATA box-binding protein-associated factor RNA polymerase I subunit B isoform X2 [Poecilia mexicana]|uniref:TATA box-binding protein-associated factor RNA polymerase I subunit B isoform X2 n=1 Tax=Poecilia mexicana TaxID=48701 RepID=UPI00072DDBB2|nr:PREDICTED: TATA box-binding protein-associated factor RNA polymerase I subunit B isoform X2 [Poecilia mexicana]
MDEEDTDGYKEPCNQCAAVDWGISDEGRFYCRSCHNVIERTREVVDMSFTSNSNRISRIGNKSRIRKSERGYIWMLCEGFQFILQNQADALLRLGVAPQFKDDVLCQMWRLYLQKSQQGYTRNPIRNLRFRGAALDSDTDMDSAAESVLSDNFTDSGSVLCSSAGSNAESSSDWLGSDYSSTGTSASWKRSRSLMTMKKTLALIHLALVWSREALTLSDLLRLVKEGHVPYVTAYEDLPEEMKLCGPDALLFHVESIPSHRSVHKEAQVLVQFLQLPAFPPIIPEALLHPAPLSLRYLTDANLPDELHRWVCVLMDRAGMADQKRHTLDGGLRPILPRYDLQAAALIIVTIKVIFGLDDHTEWDLSNKADSHDDKDMFSFRKWYKLVQAALVEAQQRRDQDTARKQWKGKKLFFVDKRDRLIVTKRRRISENVQMCLKRLSSCPAAVHYVGPSSFQFCWGDENGSDGPSLHHTKLDGVISLSNGFMTPLNLNYWHPPLRPCNPRTCVSHYPSMEPTLPRSFVWLLQLFSFMLDVEAWYLFDEVLEMERRVFGIKTPQIGQQVETRKWLRTEKTNATQTGDPVKKPRTPRKGRNGINI